MPTASLRERKKARLREELVSVSQRLFHEHGFDATTLEQICAEVEIAPRTLLNHFPSKLDLALAPLHAALDDFTAELATRGATPAVAVWRSFVERRARRLNQPDMRRMHEVLHGSLQLAAANAALQLRYELLLAEATAAERGLDRPDLFAKALASALVGINTRIYMEWREGEHGRDPTSALLEAIDFVTEHLRSPA